VPTQFGNYTKSNMHEDLRRRALESGKTVSKKARSKQSSPASSAPNSRPGSAATSRATSRIGSRNTSDDEDVDSSEDADWSISIDGMLSSTEEESYCSWKDELTTRIESILNRRGLSVHGREDDIRVYLHLIRNHFAGQQISDHGSLLLNSFLKSAKTKTKEAIPSLKAIAATVITDQSGHYYEICCPSLKSIILRSESTPTKAEAIHTLGIITVYGGGPTDATEEIMDFLLEIIESNGHSISAADASELITAALQQYGFLATQLEDMSESTQPAMEILIDQLASSHPSVQVAAGENIALLYEKSYTEVESDDELSESDADQDHAATSSQTTLKRYDPNNTLPQTMVKRYDPYRRRDQLLRTLEGLAKVSSKDLSKKDRKSLHTSFADILQSVEVPTLGPRYSAAISDADTKKEYGSRLTVKVSKKKIMRIDRWWKLHQLKALKRVLQEGFLEHFEKNEVVRQGLAGIDDAGVTGSSRALLFIARGMMKEDEFA